MARAPRRRSVPRTYALNAIVRSRRLRDPQDRQLAYITMGERGYARGGPGLVYINVQLDPDAADDFLAGRLTREQALNALLVKVGETTDITRRKGEYCRCVQPIYWHAYFHVRARKLTVAYDTKERLVHTQLAMNGAAIEPKLCDCGLYHRELFSLRAAGGLRNVERIIRFWGGAAGGIYRRVRMRRES
ncbi:hypothetical protein B0H11DRAFT_1913946 [Mycena galericulata]|nr:hypothetical protein B0H11DRAFT_1913946 [Mycena galericulata]